MTDNEIIKAMTCFDTERCLGEECPYYDLKLGCSQVLKDVYSLVYSQKAEIERLLKECEIMRAYIHNNGLEWGLVSHLEFCKNQRAEAIKEFAERLKCKLDISACGYSTEEIVSHVEDTIDNLVEEMEKET